MRVAAVLVVLIALAAAGCGEVKKELDKPGPVPPYDPKAAELDPSLVKPANPANATVTPEGDMPAEQEQPADQERSK